MMIDHQPIGLIQSRLEAHIRDPGGPFIKRTLLPDLIMESQEARFELEKFFREAL
jgi:hypothetical protein